MSVNRITVHGNITKYVYETEAYNEFLVQIGPTNWVSVSKSGKKIADVYHPHSIEYEYDVPPLNAEEIKKITDDSTDIF